MFGKRILIAAVLLLLASSASAELLAEAAMNEPRLTMTRIGPIDLPFESPGASLFAFPGDLITGNVDDLPYPEAFVQLVKRSTHGAWVATTAAIRIVRRAGVRRTPFSVSMMQLDCRNQSQQFELVAALTSRQLPVGALTDHEWSGLARTSPITVTCADFESSRLRILEVGNRLARPKEAVRVSHFEDVHVRAENTALGVLIQLCVRPADNRAMWCQESTNALTSPNWIGAAFFGRTDIVRGPNGLQFRDAWERFYVWAVEVRAPLPIRPDGIQPDEWLSLQALRLKQSDPVEVTRAYRPGDVRLDIIELGQTNDGKIRLANSAARISGGFKPLPGFIHRKREVITLLTRQANETFWTVSGAALLLGDVTRWTIPVANLNPQKGPVTSERLAIAVLSDDYFQKTESVTEDVLRERARSISDEVAFRLYEQ